MSQILTKLTKVPRQQTIIRNQTIVMMEMKPGFSLRHWNNVHEYNIQIVLQVIANAFCFTVANNSKSFHPVNSTIVNATDSNTVNPDTDITSTTAVPSTGIVYTVL